MVSSSESLQPVSQRSFESLSPLKELKKRKKHPRIKATKTKDMKPVSSKWEIIPSFEKDANIIEDKSLQAEASNQPSSMQRTHHLSKNKE